MFNGKLYYVLLALCWIYALVRGGLPEQIGAAIIVIGSQLSVAALSANAARFRSVETGLLVVDVATLISMVFLALRADRYWPLWVAALQVLGTAGHALKFADPEVIRRAYAFILAFWSYPMLALLVSGTWRHQQRLARFGSDQSWSSIKAKL